MIKYRLACNDCELSFDSWFASSKEFEKLKKKKLLICYNCNSLKVDKTLMAPTLINNKKNLNNMISMLKCITVIFVILYIFYYVCKNINYKNSVEEAIRSIDLQENDIILITGSLYLAGEVLNLN
jgi:hypothetical protein